MADKGRGVAGSGYRTSGSGTRGLPARVGQEVEWSRRQGDGSNRSSGSSCSSDSKKHSIPRSTTLYRSSVLVLPHVPFTRLLGLWIKKPIRLPICIANCTYRGAWGKESLYARGLRHEAQAFAAKHAGQDHPILDGALCLKIMSIYLSK